jgi:methylmalonyl-CoA decarboxylase
VGHHLSPCALFRAGSSHYGDCNRHGEKSPLAMAVIKEQLRVLCNYQPIAAQTFERIQDMRRKVYESAEYREGIAAFNEKRKPLFNGE